jgi:glycosyltransferase involved in cell wall biosynthesis
MPGSAEPRFSVVIPAYNAEKTLRATLDCALAQTVSPHEVLVLDDGSTDTTPEILAQYAARDPRVKYFSVPNGGLARARNHLIARATGTHVACVDADDLWHPRYLEAHANMIARFPEAVATFTHHVDFVEPAEPRWPEGEAGDPGARARLWSPRALLKAYNFEPLTFHVSCFVISLALLHEMGPEPFYVPGSGADDTFIHNRLALYGPIAHTPERLGAYCIRRDSMSQNQVFMAEKVLKSFEGLEPLFAQHADPQLRRDFAAVHAQRRRHCGKFYMGLDRPADARAQFAAALRGSRAPRSVAKSAALMALSFAPRRLQPTWPGLERKIGTAQSV